MAHQSGQAALAGKRVAARRQKLCRIYEGHGFVFPGEEQREPYLVGRYGYNLENLNKQTI